MSSLLILTADEIMLARQYRLDEFFEKNENYVLFVMESKKILDRNFENMTKSEWGKNHFVSISEEILQCSELFLEYVNDMHANRHGGTNIPKQEWKLICHAASKIIVERGWVLGSKE